VGIPVGAGNDLKAVVLGVSTGGPYALLQTIPKLPVDFPLGIAVVQHMPPRFTKSLAERLDSLSSLNVKEAEDGDILKPGVVLLAPGGRHLTFRRKGGSVAATIGSEPANSVYKPCADVMMTSAVEAFNGPLLGIIMTGWGRTGWKDSGASSKKGDSSSLRMKTRALSTGCHEPPLRQASPMRYSLSRRSPAE
jgi:two-component system chemotaxis response regulator CheB